PQSFKQRMGRLSAPFVDSPIDPPSLHRLARAANTNETGAASGTIVHGGTGATLVPAAVALAVGRQAVVTAEDLAAGLTALAIIGTRRARRQLTTASAATVTAAHAGAVAADQTGAATSARITRPTLRATAIQGAVGGDAVISAERRSARLVALRR